MSLPLLTAPIAVIDLETTGKNPFRHDRVVEVAAVVLGTDGRIEREFVSLVNPGRDIGLSSVHGLTSEDILLAPKFEEIAALLLDVLDGTVAISTHNVPFDRMFLESEFSRFECQFPVCFSIYTMRLAGGRRLEDCCRDHGISPEGDFHQALHDARAAAQLLTCLLANQPHTVQNLSKHLPIQWPTVPRTTKQPITRNEAHRRKTEPTYLQRLLEQMHGYAIPDATDGAVMSYMAVLDRELEDRHLDESDVDSLLDMAKRLGLSGDQIFRAHRAYMNQLAIAAVVDGSVSDAERRDLERVARLLSQEKRNLDEILLEAAANASETHPDPATAKPAEESLIGKRVCFTGTPLCRRDGQGISQELAEEFARKAGLVVANTVTMKLDLLVVADPDTQSGKAKKARKYGIRIMHEPLFWKKIGVNVD